jgi:hypothetical protein
MSLAARPAEPVNLQPFAQVAMRRADPCVPSLAAAVRAPEPSRPAVPMAQSC